MEEYVSLDKQIEITDIRGGTIKTTVRHILDRNNARYDVQPVVRCCDCKHKGWVQEPEHGRSVDYCRLIERCVDKQFFCAAGERKTNCGADMRGET